MYIHTPPTDRPTTTTTTTTTGFDWEPPAQAGRAVPVTPDNVAARAGAFMEAVGNKSQWCVCVWCVMCKCGCVCACGRLPPRRAAAFWR